MSAPEVISLGCRLNAFESEVMRQHSAEAGLENTVFINTCAVTAEAERQARQTIRRLRRQRPDARIVVTGCAAQLSAERYAAMVEVDDVWGNAEKLDPERFRKLAFKTPGIHVSDIMTAREVASPLIKGFGARTRAFVQVQQGCDHRCTFCIIPFARGPNRSSPADQIIDQIGSLVDDGYSEAVLTGVDISSYGLDLDGSVSLGDLAGDILKRVPDLKRLRLSSLDPAVMDERLFQLMATEERLMPHLHLSLQAGDDMVLKRMKRRHSRRDAIAFCKRARAARPDVVFGADFIAGFPTETETMFEQTRALIEELDLVYLHVFPYSSRPGTPAERMPAVPPPVRKARAATLRMVGNSVLERYLSSRIGTVTTVLVEKDGYGHCPYFAPVRLRSDATPGALVQVRITAVEDGHLMAIEAN